MKNIKNFAVEKEINYDVDIRDSKIIKYEKIMYYIHELFVIIAITILATISLSILFYTTEVNADNTEAFKYYWVDNDRDYARSLRIEACERTWRKIEVTNEQILHCATVMTLITAFESDWMQSNMCLTTNNCMWLKGRSDYMYWFLTFRSHYEANLYFAQKWWKYHYKKRLHTLIYGYIQEDWSYKWGYSTTDKWHYFNFMRNNYWKTYKEIEKLYYNK